MEKDNRGYDLISRLPHPEDPQSARDVRFIEVKGFANLGDVNLTSNEYKTAQRLGADYFLYVVTHCATSNPTLNILRDPARLEWNPIVKVERYQLKLDHLKAADRVREDKNKYM